jgi:hypothetical protein
MNPNLTADENAILAIFKANAGGRCWLSRQWLEHETQAKGIGQRKLDRILRRFERDGILVSMPTQDRGAVYALAETEESLPSLKEHAYKSPHRGKVTVSVHLGDR